MKVKAVEVDKSCGYVTEGKVYDVEASATSGLGWVVDDVGYPILIDFSDHAVCAHGVTWWIVE